MKCDLRAALRILPFIVTCAACTSSTTRPDDGTQIVVTATLSGLSVSPTSVTAGQHSTGTVLLSAGAPAGGATVSLAPDSSGRATYPASVTVPQNATTNTFDITTSATASTGTATIVGTYSGGTASAALNVTAVAPTPQVAHADFTVTPNAGTPANPNQCAVYQDTRNGALLNELRCVFDASISTPNPGITTYSWILPSGPTGTASYTGVRIASPTVACGTFAAATEKEVILTITSPVGTDTIRKLVTFVKVGPC